MTVSRFACLLLIFSVGHALADPPTPSKRGPWNAAPPEEKGEIWNFTGRMTGGYVQSIGKDGITLYRPAREVLRMRHDPKTGQLLELKKETFPAVPAKTFLLGEELAKGGYKVGAAGDTYRITDVRVGDRVRISYDRRKGVDICKTICIDRRPGGRIPPAPGEKPETFRKHHERANADQDWEDFRTPYPRKFWPTYMGPDGKFYAGPYPSESTQETPIRPKPPAKP